jgi:hypothetical protein
MRSLRISSLKAQGRFRVGATMATHKNSLLLLLLYLDAVEQGHVEMRIRQLDIQSRYTTILVKQSTQIAPLASRPPLCTASLSLRSGSPVLQKESHSNTFCGRHKIPGRVPPIPPNPHPAGMRGVIPSIHTIEPKDHQKIIPSTRYASRFQSFSVVLLPIMPKSKSRSNANKYQKFVPVMS